MTLRKRISLTLLGFGFVFASFFSSLSHAQQAPSSTRNVKRGVAIVLFSTLGGAILGLSTLSFYGEPQEHTGNITTGALVGAVTGAAILAYNSTPRADRSMDYNYSHLEQSPNKKALAIAKAPIFLSYQFDF